MTTINLQNGTVEELIESLKKFDPKGKIHIRDRYGDFDGLSRIHAESTPGIHPGFTESGFSKWTPSEQIVELT